MHIARLFVIAFVTLAVSASAAQALTPDQIARVLAGLETDALSEDEEKAKRVRDFRKEADKDWKRYTSKIGDKLHAFGASELDQSNADTIYYPFAGADIPTVQRLYPDASRYLLVALQKGGRLPSLEKYNPQTFRWFLRVYSRGWHDFARRGFFHTDHMKRDMDGEGVLEGITPILMAFSARLGYEIASVEPIKIATGGKVQVITKDVDAQESWDSVRLNLVDRKSKKKVVLDYLYLDLSDGYLKDHPDARAFVDKAATHRVVTKAASHLMQKPFFSIVKESLLKHAPSIFQDETGIDYAELSEAFDVTLYGKFTRANKLWTEGVQRSLATAYKKRDDVKPLGFKVGYRKDAGSCVQVAVRKE